MAAATDRPVTMKTLAAKLGVSVTTVSNAYSKPDRISAELRQRVLAGGKELGYTGPSAAARTLRSGKADVCGFLYGADLTQVFSDPYSSIFLTGLGEAVEAHDSSVLLLRAPHDANEEDSLLQRAVIDALVTTSPTKHHPGLAHLASRGIRVVSTQVAGADDWVGIDDHRAGHAVGAHLAGLGHRHVAIVTPSSGGDMASFTGHLEEAGLTPGTFEGERVTGIFEALPEADIRIVHAGDFGREGGRRAWATILASARETTAVVAVSDVLALGVGDGLAERAVAQGGDVSVLGFDNIPDAERAGLTTIHQPILEKGRLAGTLAMRPDYPERQITLPFELVVRSSTGPTPTI